MGIDHREPDDIRVTEGVYELARNSFEPGPEGVAQGSHGMREDRLLGHAAMLRNSNRQAEPRVGEPYRDFGPYARVPEVRCIEEIGLRKRGHA
jgi:hypothetical protein